MESTAERRTYRYEIIDPEQLSAADLRQANEQAPSGVTRSAYRLTIADNFGREHAEQADALLLDGIRLGIAWGSDAAWGDVPSDRDADIEAAFDDWLNDADAWAARN